MSDKSSEKPDKADEPTPESTDSPAVDALGPEDQSTRWLKYGLNVAIMTIAVLAVAVIAIWAAQGTHKKTEALHVRKDLSGDGSNQLKPQTIELIKDLPEEVTLVSLYPKLKKEEAAAKGEDTYQRVLDILEEYRKNGKNIKVQAIDPIADKTGIDGWLGEVKRRYGKNIEKYEKFVKDSPTALDDIGKAMENEVEPLKALLERLQKDIARFTPEQRRTLGNSVVAARSSVRQMPAMLKELGGMATTELEQKIPDYQVAAQYIRMAGSAASQTCEALATRLKGAADIAPEVKAYVDSAAPKFEAMKKKADDLIKQSEDLGELKLDDVRRKLIPPPDSDTTPPAIAVMGPDDVTVIEDFSLWKSGQSTGLRGGSADDKPKLRFAGEQQLTSAILALQKSERKRIVFVRGAGIPPLTTSRMTMMGPQTGPLSEVATRLRTYNFEVLEKDLSQQDPDPGAPPPPPGEATNAQLKGAIWVVLATPQQSRPGVPPMPGVLGMELKKHLDQGGSALCLLMPNGEDLSAALKDWGIEARMDAIAVHERVDRGNAEPNSMIERARDEPEIFILNQFGDHPLAAAARSLDAALVAVVPVKKSASPPTGVTVTEIIPIPSDPKSWGETDLDSISAPSGHPGVKPMAFDPATDVAAPIFAGAVAEKQGKGRLVVIGSAEMAFTQLVNYPDEKLQKSKTVVARFPGNGELFTNSVFWLARDEKMIALSPAALDTARIAAVPAGTLSFLRIGVVLVALPLLAVGAGLGMWLRRRG